jgi:hypothetical protein
MGSSIILDPNMGAVWPFILEAYGWTLEDNSPVGVVTLLKEEHENSVPRTFNAGRRN